MTFKTYLFANHLLLICFPEHPVVAHTVIQHNSSTLSKTYFHWYSIKHVKFIPGFYESFNAILSFQTWELMSAILCSRWMPKFFSQIFISAFNLSGLRLVVKMEDWHVTLLSHNFLEANCAHSFGWLTTISGCKAENIPTRSKVLVLFTSPVVLFSPLTFAHLSQFSCLLH